MAGTAKLVVFPLWVVDHDERLGRLGSQTVTAPCRAGHEEEPTRRHAIGGHPQRPQVAPPGPACAPRRVAVTARRPPRPTADSAFSGEGDSRQQRAAETE